MNFSEGFAKGGRPLWMSLGRTLLCEVTALDFMHLVEVLVLGLRPLQYQIIYWSNYSLSFD